MIGKIRGTIHSYTLALTSAEPESRTIYMLRMRWKKSRTGWRRYRKTWKYKVLKNALRKIQTIVAAYGKPQTLLIMGYLAQYEEQGPPGLSGPAEPR